MAEKGKNKTLYVCLAAGAIAALAVLLSYSFKSEQDEQGEDETN